jgi:formylglycine-generating enzyme required for sulfatase activity
LSWQDAIAYVEWLAKKTGKPYRLLSEAEWEYAARATTTTGSRPRYGLGDSDDGICTYANGFDQFARENIAGTSSWPALHCSDGQAYTGPVGLLSANAFGLHDMLGNVKEWTQDCFHDNQGYRGAPADGSAWASGECPFRVVRGGSWLSYARLLRVAFRSKAFVEDRRNDTGMRVGRTLLGP